MELLSKGSFNLSPQDQITQLITYPRWYWQLTAFWLALMATRIIALV
jgi:hypothetical protein